MNSENENMFSKEQRRELLKEVTSQEFSVLVEKNKYYFLFSFFIQ